MGHFDLGQLYVLTTILNVKEMAHSSFPVMGILLFFFLRESYVPYLLQKKAAKIRYETKNWAVRSKLDEREFSMTDLFESYLTKVCRVLHECRGLTDGLFCSFGSRFACYLPSPCYSY